MKAVLLVLVLGTIAPLHVRLGPVSLPVSWLVITAEILGAAGGIWLAARAFRRSRPLWCPAWISGGAW